MTCHLSEAVTPGGCVRATCSNNLWRVVTLSLPRLGLACGVCLSGPRWSLWGASGNPGTVLLGAEALSQLLSGGVGGSTTWKRGLWRFDLIAMPYFPGRIWGSGSGAWLPASFYFGFVEAGGGAAGRPGIWPWVGSRQLSLCPPWVPVHDQGPVHPPCPVCGYLKRSPWTE